jgi:hypothetical protein
MARSRIDSIINAAAAGIINPMPAHTKKFKLSQFPAVPTNLVRLSVDHRKTSRSREDNLTAYFKPMEHYGVLLGIFDLWN